MGEIESQQRKPTRGGAGRVQESLEAWSLYSEGTSKAEIARRLHRDRNTVNTLLEEAAEWHLGESHRVKIAAAVEKQRRVVEHAWGLLNSGQIKPTSLASPQYLYQIREANKEMARLEGLYLHRSQSVTTHITLADLIRQYEERRAADHVIDAEDLKEE